MHTLLHPILSKWLGFAVAVSRGSEAPSSHLFEALVSARIYARPESHKSRGGMQLVLFKVCARTTRVLHAVAFHQVLYARHRHQCGRVAIIRRSSQSSANAHISRHSACSRCRIEGRAGRVVNALDASTVSTQVLKVQIDQYTSK